MVEGTTDEEEIIDVGMTPGLRHHLAGVGMNLVDMAMIVLMNVVTPEIDTIHEIEKALEIGSSLENVKAQETDAMLQRRTDHPQNEESHQ